MGMGRPVSEVVIEKIATEEGIHPTELDRTLYEVLNPDALDALFRSRGESDELATDHVKFTYCGHTVVVTANDQVQVDADGDSATSGSNSNRSAVD